MPLAVIDGAPLHWVADRRSERCSPRHLTMDAAPRHAATRGRRLGRSCAPCIWDDLRSDIADVRSHSGYKRQCQNRNCGHRRIAQSPSTTPSNTRRPVTPSNTIAAKISDQYGVLAAQLMRDNVSGQVGIFIFARSRNCAHAHRDERREVLRPIDKFVLRSGQSSAAAGLSRHARVRCRRKWELGASQRAQAREFARWLTRADYAASARGPRSTSPFKRDPQQ